MQVLPPSWTMAHRLYLAARDLQMGWALANRRLASSQGCTVVPAPLEGDLLHGNA